MAREVTLVDAGLGNIASVERALIQVGGAVRVSRNPDEVATARTVVFPGQGAFGATTNELLHGQMGNALRMVIERGDPFLGICLGMQLLFDGSDENGGQKGFGVIPGQCRRFPDGMQIEAEAGAHEVSPQAAEAVADPARAQTMHADSRRTDAPATDAPATDAPATDAPSTDAPPPPGSHAESGETSAPSRLVRRLKVPHMGWNSVEPTGDHYYFVHSYYVQTTSNEDVMWMTTYGGIRFPAAVRRGNVLGCQFHPEKSQKAGLRFLRAFLLGGAG